MGLILKIPPRKRRSDLGGRRIYRRQKSRRQWLLLIPLGIVAGYLQHRWMDGKGWTPRATINSTSVIAATREVTCPHCVGEDGMPKGGRRHPDNFHLWEDCPVCFGAGRRIIKAPNASNQQVCPRCGGMGRYVEDAKVLPCERCEEWGLIDITQMDQKILIPDSEVPPAGDTPPIEPEPPVVEPQPPEAAPQPQPQPPVPAVPPSPSPAP